jgi:hypothetical protein
MTESGSAGALNGAWRLHLDDPDVPDVSTLDLTLADVELAEEVCGVPYVMLNPLASAREAKALLVVLLVRAGMGRDAALERAQNLNLRQLAGAFVYVPPERPLPATDRAEAGSPPR